MSQVLAVNRMSTARAAEPLKPLAAWPSQSAGNFRAALNSLKGSTEILSLAGHKDLVNFQSKLLSAHNISPRDLLLYQIRVSSFNVRVELVSKSAESLVATMRKFQNGQA